MRNKNIFAVYHNSVIDNQARSGKPKNVDSKAVLQAIEVHLNSVRWARHLTIQFGSLTLQPWQ